MLLLRARGQATGIRLLPRARRSGPTLGLRMRVWAGSLALDCRLAEGVPPSNSPELALRAQQLLSERARRALSSTLIATVDTARRPRRPTSAKTPIATAGVLGAAWQLESLAHQLVATSDPSVRGVALVSFLVCDPASPLYRRHSSVTVREIANRARSALRQLPR
jgi:hypothetical protein